MTPYSAPGLLIQNSHSILAQKIDQKLPMESISIIITKVSAIHEIPAETILSRTNKREVVYARFACMWAMRKYLGLTLMKISFALNKKEHSSVIHGINAYEDMLKMYDTQSRVLAARHKELTEYFNRVFL